MTLTPRLWKWDGDRPGHSWLAGQSEGIPFLWQVHVTGDRAAYTDLIQLLSADERGRLDRFRKPEDQLRYVVGHGVLRILAGAHLKLAPEQMAFEVGQFGKPFVVPQAGAPPLHFNLAHSGEWVLLAFSATQEVGVDVEEIRPDQDWRTVARQVFSTAEYKAWARVSGEASLPAFFQTWTRHEAGMKALGLGLTDERQAIPNDRLAYFDLALPDGYKGAAACVR